MLFGIPIEPEKEVLTLIDQNLTDKVLTTITNDVKLNVPGHGIAFVLSVDEVIGLNPVREE